MAKYSVVLILSVWCSSLTVGHPVGEGKSVNTTNNWETLIENHPTIFSKIGQHGNKKYFVTYELELSYFEANQFCESMNMRLLSIENEEVNKAIYDLVSDKKGRFWTSGANFIDKRQWVWMSTIEEATYTNWGENEPNNGYREACIEVIHMVNFEVDGLYWNDRDCRVDQNFICEKDITIDQREKQNKKERINELLLSLKKPNNSEIIPVGSFGRNMYLFGNHLEVRFMDATRICNMLDMKLAKLDTSELNTYIAFHISTKAKADETDLSTFWTSGSRLLDGKTWLWMSNREHITYTNWESFMPDYGYHDDIHNKDCIRAKVEDESSLSWRAADCGNSYYFICEKPITS